MTGPGQSKRAIRRARRALPILAVALVAALPAQALARSGARHRHGVHHDFDGHQAGAVYTATNNPSGNAVIVFRRNRDGTLTQGPTVPTGGTGIAGEPPFTFPQVDSQGSIALAQDGQLLFVVNDGDNTITSFRTTGGGLRRVDRVSSGGVLPVSLTTHGHLLYAVNEQSSAIAGFYFSNDGRLWSIPGSAQLLNPLFPSSPSAVGGVAAQIGFSPDGSQLVVTERGVPQTTGAIDTFKVNRDGSASPEQALTCPTLGTPCAAVDPNPFGFAFTKSGSLLVSNVGQVNGPINYPTGSPPLLQTPIPQALDPAEFVGSASSYSLSATGTLTPVSTEVASGGRAACWLVLSKDGRFAFVTNTLSTTAALGPPTGIGSGAGGLTTYSVGSGGSLTRLSQTDVGPGTPTDMAVSSDGKFLYVGVPTVPPPPATSHIDVFAINANGSLTPVTQGATLPLTITGLAAN
jgi:6-phosphogluconolactonase